MGNIISKKIKAIFKKRIKTIINNEHYYITGAPLSCNYNFVIRDVEVTNCFTNENFILHRKDKVQFIKTKKIDGLELMEFIFNEKNFI